MRDLVRLWLENTQGLIEPAEGERLAELASLVPRERAIVEVGSHTGLSTCWMAHGSRDGAGAHITAIDPWGDPRPDSLDDPWGLGGDGVLKRFLTNLAGTTQDVEMPSVEHLVTPLRTTSLEASRLWVQRIGLLFVDAIHEEDAVLEDWGAWRRHLAPGGWVAFHDFGESYPGCKRAIEKIAASEDWRNVSVIGSLWSAWRP